MIAAVVKVEQLPKTVFARCHVWSDQRTHVLAGMAGPYFKTAIRPARRLANGYLGYLCERRHILREARDEILNQFLRALNFDQNSCRRIADVSAKVAISCKTIDVRPEPDSLHDTGDLDFLADLHDVSRGGGRSARDFPLAIQPREPFRHCLASLAGHPNDVHIAVDAPRVRFGSNDIEWHVGQEVDLVQD